MPAALIAHQLTVQRDVHTVVAGATELPVTEARTLLAKFGPTAHVQADHRSRSPATLRRRSRAAASAR